MKRPVFLFVVAGLIFASLLAACAVPAATPVVVPQTVVVPVPQTVVSQATVLVPQTVVVPQTVAAPTSAPPQAVTIRWRTRPDNQAEQDVYQSISDELSKQLAPQGITLKYDPSPVTGYFDKLTTELSAGNAPDIFWIGGANTADFAKTGAILDLMPLAKADATFKLTDYYDAPMKEVQNNGHLWGIPRDISTLVLFYNKDLFKAKGIDDPATLQAAGKWDWDNFLRVAQALTDPAKKTYGFSMSDWWGTWGWFVYGAGGNLFSADRTTCGLTSPESQAGLQYMADIFNKYKVATPPGMEGGVGETEFVAGQAGMYPNGRWMVPEMRNSAKYDWGVVEMPKGKVNSTFLFWGPYVVSKASKYPQQDWTVIRALTSPEVQAKVAAMGTNIPSNKGQVGVDAFLASKPPADNQPFLNGASYAQAEIPLFTGSWDAIVTAIYQPAIDDILSGKSTVADATKKICASANPLFAK